MQVHREEVDEEELQQHLDRLPGDVVQIIFEKVLADQPLSQIAGLCKDERWTDLLLSNQYFLYFDVDQLLLFNFRRRLWETVSLEFLPLQGLRLLDFVASDGGLVRLITESGEFIVCNPLTKRFKRLPKPSQGLYRHCLPSALTSQLRFLTNIIASSHDQCHFKLVLNVLGPLIYDSRESNDNLEIEDGAAYEGNCFSHVGLAIRGTVFTGSLRVVTVFDVQDMETISSTFCLPVARVLEVVMNSIPKNLSRNRLDLYLVMYPARRGEDAVHLAVLRSPSSGRIHVLVWKHNLLDRSDVLLEWEEWRRPLEFSSLLLVKFKTFNPILKFFDDVSDRGI